MATKVNFANVTTDYKPREAGDYAGLLIGYKDGVSTKGMPTYSLEFTEVENPNRHMFANYSLQPQSLFGIKRDLMRLGASVEAMNAEDADLDKIVEGLLGYTATLRFGDPRPGKDKDGNDKLFDNFKELVDPAKVS